MINDIKEIIDLFSKGEMIILIDDEERENEGDLVISSRYLTAEHINFMITYGKGLVCAPISSSIAKKLKLPLMEGVNNEMQTPYTHSVDLKGDGVTTGISAEDRFKTIKGLASDDSTRDSFNVPGHIFPLQAMDGGVLRRAGHTEAAVDLCSIANHKEVAVICEIINEDGTMARLEDLIKFSKLHKIPIGTIKDLIQYRLDSSNPVEFVSKSKIPTDYGEFIGHVFKDIVDKGSITLNGVSLTVVNPDEDRFSVAVIEETYKRTNLQYLKEGSSINVEYDIVIKYLEKLNYDKWYKRNYWPVL